MDEETAPNTKDIKRYGEKLNLNDMYVIFSGMKGVRRDTIEALYDAGYNNLEKLRVSSIDELIKVNGVGQKVAEKIIKKSEEILSSIEKEISKEKIKAEKIERKTKKENVDVDLLNTLRAIPRLKEKSIKEFIKRYPTWESLRDAKQSHLMRIEGIGRNTSRRIVQLAKERIREIKSPARLEEMQDKFSGIVGVRRFNIEALYNSGYDSVEKIHDASIEDLIKIESIGKKIADKVIKRADDLLSGAEEKTKETPPERSSLYNILSGIPKIRKSTVEEIIKHYPTLDELKGAKEEDLLKIKGVGKSITRSILEIIKESKEEKVMGEGKVETKEEKVKKSAAKESFVRGFKNFFEKLKSMIFPRPNKVKQPQEPKETKEATLEIKTKIEKFDDIPGVTPEIAERLRRGGYKNIDELKEASIEDLIMIEGIEEKTANNILQSLK